MNTHLSGRTTSIKKRGAWRKDLIRNYELYLFVLPGIIVIVLFNYLPMYGVQIAFKNFRPILGIWNSDWVGWKWFARFFSSAQFGTLISNTLMLNFYLLIVTFPLPIGMALLFNQFRNKRIRKTLQTVSYAPHFISTVVLVGMLTLFLSPTRGLYGNIVRLFGGMPGNPMGEAGLFQSIYVWSDVWQHTGWDSIIYLAALSSVDPQLYDAATVDGASRIQKILHVEIPALTATASILLIMRVGNLMSIGFEKVYLMQNSLNLSTSEVISTYVYKVGLTKTAQYSYSAAVGLFNTLINLILLTACNYTTRRISGNSLW
ncbi:MAG: ABC transporter permease subunit [Bacillota bacterium]